MLDTLYFKIWVKTILIHIFRQLEDKARRLKLQQQSGNKQQPTALQPKGQVKRSDALQSKPGTQIKITRTPSGGVEFTTVPSSTSSVTVQETTSSSSHHGHSPQGHHGHPPQGHHHGHPHGRPQMQQQPQEPPRPSVPSKTGAPMVTIRRIETPNSEPMVTISMANNNKNNGSTGNGTAGNQNKEDKLLYTLVNGQAMRTPEAPSDLLPNAKLVENLSKKQKKKLKKQGKLQNELQQLPSVSCNPVVPGSNPSFVPPPQVTPSSTPNSAPARTAVAPQRPPLPLDAQGKVDLERLQLPPGIRYVFT